MQGRLCHSVQQKGRRAWQTLCRPTVRHSLHYHCGLYPEEHGRAPISSFRLDHDSSCPLLRVLALMGLLMLVVLSVSSLCHAIAARRSRGQGCHCED